MIANNILLAVDIGGTFTDIVLLDTNTHTIAVEKVLTTYPDPAIAVLDGIAQLLAQTGIPPAAITYVVHGTTLITNYTVQGLLQCQQYQAKVEALCGDGVLMSVKTVTAHTGNVERDESHID